MKYLKWLHHKPREIHPHGFPVVFMSKDYKEGYTTELPIDGKSIDMETAQSVMNINTPSQKFCTIINRKEGKE
jgi:hypothetical protein